MIRPVTELASALLVAIAVVSATARADETSALRDLCVDRPGKGTSPCTLDAGHFQIEADIFNGTFDRADGRTTRTYFYANPTFKYGVGDNFDIEANLAPLVEVQTKTAGATQTLTGIGDLFLRAKFDILGNGSSPLGLAVEPYVKIPTARDGIGDGALEGGTLVPMALDLGDGWSLSATPEADILKNAGSDGRHVALSNVVGIGRGVGSGVSLGVELWAATDFDPAANTQQYSLDLAAAWQPDGEPDLQFDGGVNWGLNSATPDLQVYAGVSRRF